MKHTILVIDDEEFILSSLYRLLRREFNVLLANSAQEGLEKMNQQEVHVVVSDQRMPEMVGVEFLEIIKGEYPDAIRMLLTGYADLESVIAAINSGNIYRYIVKPWNPEELLAEIREAVTKYDLIVNNRNLTKSLLESNTELERRVTERTNELERSNQLITDLTHAIVHLQDEFNLETINTILESELKTFNFYSSILFLDTYYPILNDNFENNNQSIFSSINLCKKVLQSDPTIRDVINSQTVEYRENFYEWYANAKINFEAEMPCLSQEMSQINENSKGLFLPLKTLEGLSGILILWGDDLRREDINPLSLFSKQVALIIQNAYYFENLRMLAEIDSLTDVFNRRKILEIAEDEYARSKRLNQKFSVIMIDLNEFKGINDSFGHLVGDAVLKFAAQKMRSVLRKDVDSIGRYGGDEFLIVLPETDLDQVKAISDRIRKFIKISQNQFAPGLDSITVSIGEASLTDTSKSLSEMIDIADKNMYQDKNNFKNNLISPK